MIWLARLLGRMAEVLDPSTSCTDCGTSDRICLARHDGYCCPRCEVTGGTTHEAA